MNTPKMPGNVATVLLMPQITSAYFGAMSKPFGAKPARPQPNAAAAPHISSTASPGVAAPGSSQRNSAPPNSETDCISLRTNPAPRPRRIIRSARKPAIFADPKLTSHGAADSRPALLSETWNVVLQ